MTTRPHIRRPVFYSQREDALEGAREVRANLADAIEQSVEHRPYTTLALATALGFLLGTLTAR